MFCKILSSSKKLTLDELRQLQARLQEEIRTRTECSSATREILEERTVGSTSYSLQTIRCGKKGCKCSRGELHRPHWYAHFRENGKMG